jgi:dipeptidyl aminopeptidase/acylaminoacyl peptidase
VLKGMPESPATVELLLPPGATATVAGKPLGDERTFKVTEFDVATQVNKVEVKVKYADGSEVQRLVEVKPFAQVKVPLSQVPVDTPTTVLTESPDPMLWAEFNPKGTQLVTASEKGAVILWDMQAGRVVRSFAGHGAEVLTVTFSADGQRLLTASADMLAILWNVNTGKIIRRFKAHSATVTAAAFSADEKRIVTSSADKTAILWDTETGAQIRTFSGHTDEVVAVAMSPDGKLVATGSTDKSLIIWNAETGEQAQKFTTQDTVSGVEFTADGKFFGSSNFSNVATIYELPAFKALGGTRRNNLDLNAIGFTPDGRRFYTAGKDAVARLWDTNTRQMVREFNGHGNDIQSVRPSRDGSMLLTASRDGTVRLFDHATGMELASLATTNGGRNWAVVAPDGLYDASESGRRMIGYRFSTKLPGATVDQFFQDFYRPGLLAALMRGERPLAPKQLGQQLPPLVKIVSPKPRSTTEDGKVELVVEVEDQGGGVSAPHIYNHGARLVVTPQAKTEGKTTTYTYQIDLPGGPNQLRITSASADGSWESIATEIDLTSGKRPERKPRLFVVTVGIGEYADAKLNLKQAGSDAKALADLVQRRGTGLYERVDVVPLLGKDATRARVREALADVAALSQSQDTVMLLLCGRGTMLDQHLYLAPQDFRAGQAGWEKELRTQGLDADDLAATLGTARALNRVMIVDAAEPAPARPAGETGSFALRGAVERWSRTQGVYAIAACAPAKPAADASSGLLAGLLLDAATPSSLGAGSSSDPVGVMEWFNTATERAGPVLEKMGLTSQALQQSTKLKGFPLLAAVR